MCNLKHSLCVIAIPQGARRQLSLYHLVLLPHINHMFMHYGLQVVDIDAFLSTATVGRVPGPPHHTPNTHYFNCSAQVVILDRIFNRHERWRRQ